MISLDDYGDVVIRLIAMRLDYNSILSMKQTSHRMKSILSDPFLWIEKCEHDRIVAPSLEFRRILSELAKRENKEHECQWDFERLWLHNPFGCNLVPPIDRVIYQMSLSGLECSRWNPDLIAAFAEMQKKYGCNFARRTELVPHLLPRLTSDKWKCEWEDRGIVVEEPPFECEPHPDIERCFATDRNWGDRRITIDLVKAGIPIVVLDHIRPRITVSELAATREHCRTRYFLYAQLLRGDEKFTFNPDKSKAQCRFREEGRYWRRGTKPATWEKVKVIFENYPMGVRKIVVESKGSAHEDPQKPGMCGSKYANLEIRIELPDEVRWLKDTDFPDVST